MALRKPSDFFVREEVVEETKGSVLNTDNSLCEELNRVENLSEEISKLQQDIYQKTVENNSVVFFKEQVSQLSNIVNNLVENEIPKYKKQVAGNEIRLSNQVSNFKEDIDRKVDSFYKKISEFTDVIHVLETVSTIEKYVQENHKEFVSLREEIFEELNNIPLGNIQNNIKILEEKIDLIAENYSQIQESILNEPPDVENSDPLTPLDQKFVTVEDLNKHYSLFINRIQEQLATIGGGGETQLKYLDDIVGIATNPSAYNGKFLKYDHSIGKFIFDDVIAGLTTETQTLNNVLGLGNTSSTGISVGVVTATSFSGPLSGNVNSSGISTFGFSNGIGTVTVGLGTFALHVNGNAKVTDILTVGSSSVTIDGINDEIRVGSGVKIYGNTGIISATSLNIAGSLIGDGSNLTGVVTSLVGYSTEGYVDSAVAGIVTFSGNYNDLSNKPTIPADTGDLTNNAGFVTSGIVVGYATEGYVDSAVVGFVTSGIVVGYATEGYVDSAVAGIVTFSGNYNDLSNKPTIPADTGDLTNNAGFVTSGIVVGYATEGYVTSSLVGYATETYVDVAVAGINTFTGAATTITTTQISNWDTSYGWGDHSVVGYATEAVTSSLQAQINSLGTNLNIIGFYNAEVGVVTSLTVVGETRGYISVGSTLPSVGITTGDYLIISTGGSDVGVASYISLGISTSYPGDWIVGVGNSEWNILSYSQQVIAPRATNADFADTLKANSNVNTTGIITASSFVKTGGTSSEFLKADGTVDSNTYLTSYTETDTLDLVTGRGNSTSNGISVGIVTASNQIKIESSDSNPGRIDLFCEVGNIHYTRLQAAHHSEYSGNAVVNLPAINGDMIVGNTNVAISKNINTVGILTASSFVKSGGTSSQFLKADGSVDSSVYATQSYVGLATVGLASVSYVDTAVAGVSAGSTENVRTNSLNVVGVSTFTGNIDANGDLDVDGHTELDNLNVSGVSTFVGAISGSTATFTTGSFTGDLTADGTLTCGSITNVDSVGVITARNAVNAQRGLTVGAGLSVVGVSTFNSDVFVGSGITIRAFSGIVSATTFYGDLVGDVTGSITDATNLTGGYANASQLNVTGISTFSNNVLCSATVSANSLTATSGISASGGNVNVTNGNIYFGTTEKELGWSSGNGIIRTIGSGRSLSVQGGNPGENMGVFTQGGSVELYYNNAKKFETLGTGVTVTGTTFTNQLSVSGVVTATTFYGDLVGSITDATNLTGGTANASSLNVSGIATISAGRIQADAGSNLRFGNLPAGSGSGRNIAIGDQVLASLSGGSGRNIGIGELSYYDTTIGQYNIGIGIQAGQKITSGSYNVIIGGYNGQTGLDLRTSSNNVVIADGQGNIRQYINSSGNVGIKTTTASEALTVTGIVSATSFYGTLNASQLTGILPAIDGSNLFGVTATGAGVEIRDDGSIVGTAATIDFGSNIDVSFGSGIATVSASIAGINTTGTSTFNQLSVSGVSIFQDNIRLGDNVNIQLGNDQDFNISHVGGSSYIEAFHNTLRLKSIFNDIVHQAPVHTFKNGVDNETLAVFTENGSVALYYDNSKKFETLGTGVTVTGTTFTNQLSISGNTNSTGIITASSFSGSGANLTSLPAGQLTGTLPAIDGSALLNVNATGSGIVVEDNTVNVGSARTVNFGTGLDVTYSSSGIATITASGGSLQSRTIVSGSTTSISDLGIGNTDITGFKSYALMKVGLSTAGWLRLYTDSTSRANDISRSIGEDPSPGSGVIAEVVTTGISTTQIISPFVMGGNLDNPSDTTIYASIKNLSGSTQSITANLTILQLEA